MTAKERGAPRSWDGGAHAARACGRTGCPRLGGSFRPRTARSCVYVARSLRACDARSTRQCDARSPRPGLPSRPLRRARRRAAGAQGRALSDRVSAWRGGLNRVSPWVPRHRTDSRGRAGLCGCTGGTRALPPSPLPASPPEAASPAAEAPRGGRLCNVPARQLLELLTARTFGACREGARPQERRIRS